MHNLLHKPANIVVPVLLFILLSPGLIVKLPSENSNKVESTLVHASIFLVIYVLLRIVFSKYY